MKLIIVRHGETNHNVTNTHVGQLDVPLNDRGLQQAKAVAQRLANEHLDVIYTSDLQRAEITARTIAAYHQTTPFHVDPLLRERNIGALTGKPILPEDSIRQSLGGKVDRSKRPDGGESIQDVKQRATTWLQLVVQRHAGQTVLIAGHGLFLYVLLEVAVEQGADANRDDFILDNTSITVLNVHPEGRATVIHLNDTQHLTDTVGKLKDE